MKLLLDENCPIQLYRRLREAGEQVEHLIVSGQQTGRPTLFELDEPPV